MLRTKRLTATLALASLVTLVTIADVRAAQSATTQAEVDSILRTVADSGCEFQRNGSWYDAHKAEQHLRDKYDWLKARNAVNSTEQFIERAATKSSLSGKPYMIRCSGSAAVASATWLRKQLDRLRHAN